MAAFKKINVKYFPKSGHKVTPDTLYWKRLGTPVLIKEFGPVDYIDVSPAEPHLFAVTCSARVQLYHPITRVSFRNLNRFQETAYGGSFRSDGNLLCAGGSETHIKLFDVKNKALLRVFKGHSSPVHRCFFTLDKNHIASFSDDMTARIWDIPNEKEVAHFSDHTDYVRAGAVSPVSQDIILSGGYDHTVRMYDKRTRSCVFCVDHGAPVESLLFLPVGGVFISAGGTDVKVWDSLTGGRLIAKMSQHHKTITCLRLASDDKRLLSGSLDRHVKIYDIATYQTVHTLDYPSAILSMGIVNDDTVIVGMVDGLVSVARRDEEVKPTKREREKITYHHMPQKPSDTTDEVVKEDEDAADLAKYDEFFKKFQYSKALDRVLLPYCVNRYPEATVSVMQELIRRKGLASALGGREGRSLFRIIRFLQRYIGHARFTKTLVDVAHVFIDIYGGTLNENPELQKLFQQLLHRVAVEEDTIKDMFALQGAIQMVLAGSITSMNSVPVSAAVSGARKGHGLEPSKDAAADFVVSVS